MEKARKPKHYVNNAELYRVMKEYNAKLKSDPNTKTPEYVGAAIMMICQRLATRPNFLHYTFVDEMIEDGIENCVKGIKSFDPERFTNPFAYFTQIAWNAFIRRIPTEKKETYIKHKNMQMMYMDSSLVDDSGVSMKDNDLSNEVIRSFEESLTKKKNKAKMGLEAFVEETV